MNKVIAQSLLAGAIAIVAWSLAMPYRAFASEAMKSGMEKSRPQARLTVLGPNGGEKLKAGEYYQIRWNVSPMENGRYPDNFTIWLIDRRSGKREELFPRIAADYGVLWLVEPSRPDMKEGKKHGTGRYLIRIECYFAGQCVGDQSDRPFDIVERGI